MCISGCVTVLIAWLFYDSPWAAIVYLICLPLVRKYYFDYTQSKVNREKMTELKEVLLLLSSYMQVGESIENALLETEREMQKLYHTKSHIMNSLHQMNSKIAVSIPVERAFSDFSKEVDLEEAYEFSDILFYAKRLGGNYLSILQKTAARLEEKLEVLQEIETMAAEKQLEMKVMVAMPILILSYIKVTSYDFIEKLYHCSEGVFVMSICLAIYFSMIALGNKILKISV